MMEITKSQHNHICVVKASGRVDSFTSPRLADTFRLILESRQYILVFNMTEIDYISSAGLRVMIDVQKTCRQDSKGELVLVGVQKRIYETLELAGFVALFRFFNSVEDVLNIL
jgi:anti-sigma B factor antagonist